ncbi:hypothetical protein ACVWWN_005088 [Mycobacterium sp. URHB0021]|jgi:hypothetical protein
MRFTDPGAANDFGDHGAPNTEPARENPQSFGSALKLFRTDLPVK